MYRDRFGLRCKPFGNTPDPTFFYFSPEHQEALVTLSRGIEDRCGLMLLLGEGGTGKTAICCHIHSQDSYISGYLNYPYLTEAEFLETVNESLAVPVGDGSRYRTNKELYDYLLKQHEQGKAVVLIVDEAHRLGFPILDEILILSNLQVSNAHLVQIILVGQPSLLDTLRHPHLISLNQRIGIRYDLPRMDRANTIDYVWHRLEKAGCTNSDLLSSSALETIWERSRGTPRLINQLGELALSEAYREGRKRVGRREVMKVADDPLYQPLYGASKKQRPLATAFASVALALCAGLFFGLWYFGAGSDYRLMKAGPGSEVSVPAAENKLVKKQVVVPEPGKDLVEEPADNMKAEQGVTKPVLPELAKDLADGPIDRMRVEPEVTVPVVAYGEAKLVPPDYQDREITSFGEPLATDDALPGLKLNAIAWDENPERRIAVLNDKIVHEGDFLGDIRILRIKNNHVVLLDGDEHVIKKIRAEAREEMPSAEVTETIAGEEKSSASKPSDELQAAEVLPFADYGPTINFDYNTYEIAPEAYEALDRLAAIAKLSLEQEVVIRGYADNVGSHRYNEGLSRARARIVLGYLVKKGVSPERIQAIGMGENNPLLPNDTPEGRAANRRVEIELVAAGDY
jgi:type II secretory pathway predicted ATPase ExeA/outer membrane protein OmpA-like peptidoglycan-associated protein